MQPTQVRDLQGLINEQNAALKPQTDLLNKDIAANDASGVAQIAGLDAKQKTAFGQIEQTAQDKGQFFSGFSPDAQAGYTAGTYLPALAELQSTIANTRSNLLGKKADLGKSAFDSAFQTREGDIKTANDWKRMTADQQFQREQTASTQAFQKAQAQLDRNAQASLASANRQAQADNNPTTDQFLVQSFAGYQPRSQEFANYTEREVIPSLKANYGLSQKDAAKLAYSYRKSVYGE